MFFSTFQYANRATLFLLGLLLFNGIADGQLTDPTTVEVGDTICYEGYVMDHKCIELGTLVDNPTLISLQNPDVHSVHCIVDVPACLASDLEILADRPAGELNYTRAFRLDAEGHDTLVEILQQNGNCSSCSGSMASERFPLVVRGFRAEVNGIVTNTSTTVNGEVLPATIRLLNASRSNGASVICGVEQLQVTPAPAPSPTASKNTGSGASALKLLISYGVMMLVPLTLIL